MTANIEDVYSDFRTITNYTSDNIIDFFKKNTLYFDTIANFKNPSELKLYIEMMWQYMNALNKKERYNDALDEAIKHLPKIDSEIERFNINELKDDWYYGLIFLKGKAYYNLKDYKTSTAIFKQLTSHDPGNDMYKNWLDWSKHNQKLWIIYLIWSVSALIMFIELFFHELIPSWPVRLTLLTIGFIGVITNLVGDYLIRRSFRKKNLD